MGVVDRAVEWAIQIANDPSHGYSQEQNIRWGNPDYDCSSFVISAYKHAGVPLTSTYTGNMRSDFLNHGFAIPINVNLATGEGLKKGDVLLNERKHTALCIGDGRIVHASGNEFGGVTGGQPGDQTGREIYIGWYYNFPWDYVLRYVRDESEETPEMPYDDAKENEDYYIVKAGDSLWSIAERFLGEGGLYPLLQQINGMGQSVTVYPGMVLLLHPEGLEPETPSKPEPEPPAEPDPPEESTGGAGAYMIALQVLKKGDRGSTVKQAQRLIIASGYKLPKYGADGDFGSETESAVIKFQAANGLEQTGTVDKATMSKLLGL